MTSKPNSTYEVRLSRKAENYIRHSDHPTRQRIATAIEAIRINPTKGPRIKPLVTSKHDYRYHLGNLRIIYAVHKEDSLIEIIIIRPRGDAYNK